jgi:hypothetical protein
MVETIDALKAEKASTTADYQRRLRLKDCQLESAAARAAFLEQRIQFLQSSNGQIATSLSNALTLPWQYTKSSNWSREDPAAVVYIITDGVGCVFSSAVRAILADSSLDEGAAVVAMIFVVDGCLEHSDRFFDRNGGYRLNSQGFSKHREGKDSSRYASIECDRLLLNYSNCETAYASRRQLCFDLDFAGGGA